MASEHGTRAMRSLVAGTRLGRYVIAERIGQGGMAEVFLARAEGPHGFEKVVALKVIREQMIDDPLHVELLHKEARLAATLDHPGIVQVFDVGAEHGEHYLTMEYVHGRDLREVLKACSGRARMPLPLALFVVHEIAEALHYAHTRCDASGRPLGIVHRDVSPSNVMIAFEGAVKLTDFGIAKITTQTAQTTTGTFKGKFGYMSPEQCLQLDLDARSDVFALGIVLYELTTSRRAFAGENPFAALNRAVEGRYEPPEHIVPDYPRELSRIVRRALAPQRDDRHADARGLALELEALARTMGGMPTRSDLRAWIGELLGWPAPPDVTAISAMASIEAPTVIERSMSSLRQRRRTSTRRVAVIGAVAIAGLVGWRAGRSGAEEPSVAPREPVVAPRVVDDAPAEPSVASPRVEAPPGAARPTATVAAPTRTSTRSPARPSKRKPSPRPRSRDDAAGIESLLPPSAKPSR